MVLYAFLFSTSFQEPFILFTLYFLSTRPVLFQGTSDFCVSPDKYLLSQTKGIIGAGEFQRE